jgi:cytochrome c
MKYQDTLFRLLRLQLAVIAILTYASIVHADSIAGDPAAGSDVFAGECSDCHSVKQGKNKKGPSLFGIIGRQSASIADFSYSDDMKSLNVVWTMEKIDSYITRPKAVVPGGKMKYDGLADPKKRADVLAFLATKK